MARIARVSNIKSVTRGLKFHPQKANGHIRYIRIYRSLLYEVCTVLKEDMVLKCYSCASFRVGTLTEAKESEGVAVYSKFIVQTGNWSLSTGRRKGVTYSVID